MVQHMLINPLIKLKADATFLWLVDDLFRICAIARLPR
jgi:hypothetical protein